MTKIILEKSLQTKLGDLVGELELCDESGHTLGYYIPASKTDESLYAWARAQFTDEEIDGARQEAGGLTIDQVVSGLSES